jgi:hypothetical protein
VPENPCRDVIESFALGLFLKRLAIGLPAAEFECGVTLGFTVHVGTVIQIGNLFNVGCLFPHCGYNTPMQAGTLTNDILAKPDFPLWCQPAKAGFRFWN